MGKLTNFAKAASILWQLKLSERDSEYKYRAIKASLTDSKLSDRHGRIYATREVLAAPIMGEPLVFAVVKTGTKACENFLDENKANIDLEMLLMMKNKSGETLLEVLMEENLAQKFIMPYMSKLGEQAKNTNMTNAGLITEALQPELIASIGTPKFRKTLAMTKKYFGNIGDIKCFDSFAMSLFEEEIIDILHDPAMLAQHTNRPSGGETHPKIYAKLPTKLFIDPPEPILNLAKTGNLHLAPREVIVQAINLKDSNAQTILHHAIATGTISAIPPKEITETALSERDKFGLTPLNSVIAQLNDKQLKQEFGSVEWTMSMAPLLNAPTPDTKDYVANLRSSLMYLMQHAIKLPSGSAPKETVDTHNAKLEMQAPKTEIELEMF